MAFFRGAAEWRLSDGASGRGAETLEWLVGDSVVLETSPLILNTVL